MVEVDGVADAYALRFKLLPLPILHGFYFEYFIAFFCEDEPVGVSSQVAAEGGVFPLLPCVGVDGKYVDACLLEVFDDKVFNEVAYLEDTQDGGGWFFLRVSAQGIL